MAATPDTGGRGQIVWRVDRVDPGAQHGDAQPCLPPNQDGDARQACRLIGAVGDRAVAASGREGSHSHPGRERRGEMDLVASPRCPPPREGIVHRAHAEREEPGTNPGESEGATGGGPAKAPAPGDGAKREAGCQRPGRTTRRETGGDSKAAPESTAAIYTANRSVTKRPGAGPGDPGAVNGIRQPRGARRRGEAATANGTRQPHGARRRVDTATGNRTCQGGAGPQGDTAAGTKQSCGARRRATTSRTSQGDAGHRSDTAACTSRSGDADCCGTANGAWQPRGARRQGHSAACNRTIQGGTGHQSDSTVSRRRGNGAATHTSGPGCAGPAASGTRGTSKTSLPAVHQKDPSRTAAKEEGRDDRRPGGLYLPATLASKSDPRFEATSHDRRRVALCSPSPLSAAATFQQ